MYINASTMINNDKTSLCFNLPIGHSIYYRYRKQFVISIERCTFHTPDQPTVNLHFARDVSREIMKNQ